MAAHSEKHEELLRELQKTRKYGHVCEATLRRILASAEARHSSQRDALKAAKRKLHQICGAYAGQPIRGGLETSPGAGAPGPEHLREICLAIMKQHASTRERIPILGEVFPAIFERIPQPESILDVACGLNPYALPWMPLGREVRYAACDIDGRVVEAVNDLFAALGQKGEAFCHDVLVEAPQDEVDVALLFKTLPCLERQEHGAALELMRRLRCRHAVVSFPTKSLGGRRKGMADHYGQFMEGLLEALAAPAECLAFANEVFYIADLSARARAS